MPTEIRPFHTKFCNHSVVCQNHHSQGVSQHCLPGKPSPVPQKTGGKNSLVPTYRTLRQPLHSLSNNPDLCRRQNLHLKGSHDFHLSSVHLHRLPPPSTARQIFLHDSLHHSITLAIIHRAQITSPPDSSPLGGHSTSIFQIGGVATMPLGLIPVLPSEEHLASNKGLESPILYEMWGDRPSPTVEEKSQWTSQQTVAAWSKQRRRSFRMEQYTDWKPTG